MKRAYWASVRKLIKSYENSDLKDNYSFVRHEIGRLDRENLEDAIRIMPKNYPEAYEACKGALEAREADFKREDDIPDGEILWVAFHYYDHGVIYKNKDVTQISDLEMQFLREGDYFGLGGNFEKIEIRKHKKDSYWFCGSYEFGFEVREVYDLAVYRKGEGIDDHFRPGELEEINDRNYD